MHLDGRLLVMDVGVSFPSADMLGIDLVLPDMQYVRDRADDVEAVVLTHGHEDHVGALPYLLKDLGRPLPVIGTAFTLELLGNKLEQHQVTALARPTLAIPGEGLTVGPFSMRFLHVTHSIPDGMAVAVDTPFGTVLHTGDFKIDQTPIDGLPTDLHGFAEEAGRGVHLLLSESTNAEEPGHTASERTVGPVLRDIVERAPGIVVVACFSSHIHRTQQVIDAAIANHRVVAFLGRSKSLCREVGQMFVVAPVVSVLCAVIAFVLANHLDYPPGQLAAAIFGAALVAAWGHRLRRQ